MRLDAATTTTTSLVLTLLTLSSVAVAARPKDAILLSEVKSLTLRSPQKTTGRRLAPVPQLKCLSNPRLCQLAGIKTMRCNNEGSSYTHEDIQWSCTAPLPPTLRLDATDVICEGYASSSDPYVLRGSCGVEYTLQLTEEGRRRHPDLYKKTKEGDWAGYLFGVVFVAVLGWIIWSACVQARGNGGNNNGGGGGGGRRGWGGGGGGGGWGPGWGGGGGGGGGGGNGWDDPPPPYPGSGGRPGPKASSSASASGEQGWRPGFWSGLAGGAAAGYMAGSRGQRNNERNYGRGWGNDGGSSWGSGSGSGWGSSGRSSSSGSSGSGARYESTGYGTTSRR